jgi:KipI family sensor histidine kinase inhibitor
MRIERLGERAVIVRDLPCAPYFLAKRLNENLSTSMIEAVASYETVGLYFSEPPGSLADLDEWVRFQCSPEIEPHPVRKHRLPVCYELGEDLETSAERLGLSVEDLIGLHMKSAYRCYAVGFSPGFAYLGYLDEHLDLPRLSSPRKRVEPGSVGITGRQTAVYPSATPGGWNLIGRCPVQLVEVSEEYFPIEAGDEIEFYRIDDIEFERLKGGRL